MPDPVITILTLKKYLPHFEVLKLERGTRLALHVVERAEELLEAGNQCKPDVVLLESIQEDLDGADYLARLCSDDILKNAIAILVCSGTSTKAVQQAMLGGVEFILDQSSAEIFLPDRVKKALQIALHQKFEEQRDESAIGELELTRAKLRKLRKGIALGTKKINDALQVMALTSESHRFSELDDSQKWELFHLNCMEYMRDSLEKLRKSLDELQVAGGVDLLNDAELWDLVKEK